MSTHQFKVGDAVFIYRLRDARGTIAAAVFEATITEVIPNYCRKLGLRYAAKRQGEMALAYRPEKVFATREAAAAALRKLAEAEIAKIQAAVAQLD